MPPAGQATGGLPAPPSHAAGAFGTHEAPDAAMQPLNPLQVSAHSLSGSVRTVMAPQVPSGLPLFAWTHAWQVPLQTVLQQTLSTQLPDKHVPPAAHAAPSGLPHAPLPLQTSVPAHSLSGSAPDAIGPQVPFAPEPFLAALQAWQAPPHATLQQTPSTQ